MDANTHKEIHPAPAVAVAVKPEWVRVADAVKLFGIGRSSLYVLIAEGSIKSVSHRKRGKARGIRLLHADSIGAYLERLAAADANGKGGPDA